MRRRHLVNGRAVARSSEWAQHFSNASFYIKVTRQMGGTGGKVRCIRLLYFSLYNGRRATVVSKIIDAVL